jgi:hypothetical protein
MGDATVVQSILNFVKTFDSQLTTA